VSVLSLFSFVLRTKRVYPHGATVSFKGCLGLGLSNKELESKDINNDIVLLYNSTYRLRPKPT
jgi:hypothetical protein